MGLAPTLVPGDPMADKEITRFQIAAFHTSFNLINTVLLIWFTRTLASFVSRTVDRLSGGPEQTGSAEAQFHHLEAGNIGTASLSVLEAEQLTMRLVGRVLRVYTRLESLLQNGFDDTKVKTIFETEAQIDAVHLRLLEYLSELQESGVRGAEARVVANNIARVKAVESLGDICARVARKTWRANRENITLLKPDRESLERYMGLIRDQMWLLRYNVAYLDAPAVKKGTQSFRKQILAYHDREVREAEARSKPDADTALATFYYLDLLRNMDRISDELYVIAIAGPPPGARRQYSLPPAKGGRTKSKKKAARA